MSWVKLCENFADHPKVLAAGPEGVCLWVCGLAYCNRQSKRDGFIPAVKVALLYPMPKPARVAYRLVAVGLWERVEGGYVIHDYHTYQPSVEAQEKLRAARAESGRIGGQRSGATRRGDPPEANLKQVASDDEATDEANSKQVASSETKPVPSRPVPFRSDPEENTLAQPERAARAVRATRSLPEGFDAFWQRYPRRLGKADAQKAWRTLAPDAALQAVIAADLAVRIDSDAWRKDGGQFVPYPATYLRKGLWPDATAGAPSAPARFGIDTEALAAEKAARRALIAAERIAPNGSSVVSA
jgi:hypothetical protein